MRWLALVVFICILLGHFGYTTSRSAAVEGGQWATYEFDVPEETPLEHYLEHGNYWLGLSYGLAGAFAAWCFGRMLILRRASLAASASWLTLSGILAASVCFLAGCCGSPMLPLYLGLLGPSFLGVTKPLTFAITLLSIAIGYVWLVCKVPEGS